MAQTEPHGWLCSETLATRSGDFEFVNGYPTDDTAQRLGNLQLFNRATEVYLTQLMPVSEMALRQGLRAFGASKPTQVAVWEAADGRQDPAADREHRNGLCHKPSRAQGRRPDGDRSATAHAGLHPGRAATLSGRHRPTRPRQGRGRQVPGAAAGLRRAMSPTGTSWCGRRRTRSRSPCVASRSTGAPMRPSS